MHVIGDVHGKFVALSKILKDIDDDVLCVGDVGIGFPGIGDGWSFRKNFFAIRGNHDKPAAAAAHPQFVKDYGMWRDVFVIAGARSLEFDRINRTEYVDWWADEQLSYGSCMKAIEAYKEAKPDVVVSHDAPFSLHQKLLSYVAQGRRDREIITPYATTQAMEEMLAIHEPKLWLFGHWHCSLGIQQGMTYFRCLDELEVVDLSKLLGSLNSGKIISGRGLDH